MEDVTALLSRVSLFRSAPAGAVPELVRAGVTRRLGRGEFLFLGGDRPGGIYFVLAGQIFRQGTDGPETTLHLVGPGEFVGLMAALADRPLPAAARAITEAVVLWVPADRFRAFLVRHPEVALGLLGLLAERLHDRTCWPAWPGSRPTRP